MSTGNFPACVAITLGYEGGNSNDPHDPGGRTSRGIIQREWNRYLQTHRGLPADVYKAPQSAILDIYETEYWDVCAGEIFPRGVDLAVFDANVNSGPGNSLKWARSMMAQSAGTFAQLAAMAVAYRDHADLVKRYCARRLSFLHALRTWQFFGGGWGERVAGIEAIGVKWALQATGAPAPNVQHELTTTGAHAKVTSKQNAGGAAAGTAGAGTGAGAWSWGWDQQTLEVSLAIAAILAGVVVLIWRAHVHNQRAKAYAAAAASTVGAPA